MGDDYKTREALRMAPQSWGAPRVQHKKAVAPEQAGAPGSAGDSAAPSTQIVPAEPESAVVSWGDDCPAGQLGVNTRESGLAPWKPEEWDESNRIVQDVPITVGVPGTPSFRVIHGSPSANGMATNHGLPSSMITGRGRIALSGRESLGSKKPVARELTCPEVARGSYSKRAATLYPNYSTQLPVDLDLAAARMFYQDREHSWGDRTISNGYGLGQQGALHHLDYLPRKDLIYPSAAATVLQAHCPEYRNREELMIGSSVLPPAERQHMLGAHAHNTATKMMGPTVEAAHSLEARLALPPYVESKLRKEAQWDGYMAVCRTANVAPHSSF